MDNLQMLNFIVGFLSPIVIAMINRPFWDNRLKVLVMVLFSAAAGFLTVYFSGELTPDDVVKSILTTITATIVAYQGIFKPSGVTAKITLATSPENKLDRSDRSG